MGFVIRVYMYFIITPKRRGAGAGPKPLDPH